MYKPSPRIKRGCDAYNINTWLLAVSIDTGYYWLSGDVIVHRLFEEDDTERWKNETDDDLTEDEYGLSRIF